MAIKRLFFGTFVDSTLFNDTMNELRNSFSEVCTGKWTESNILHFTYKFLGNVDEEKIPDIRKYVSRSLRETNSSLRLGGLGFFPLNNNPNILFAKVFDPHKSVFGHFNNIEKNMVRLGFQPEKRKFFPHITLLRIKTAQSDFKDVFDKLKEVQFGLMKSYRINLIESTLTPEGPIYKILV